MAERRPAFGGHTTCPRLYHRPCRPTRSDPRGTTRLLGSRAGGLADLRNHGHDPEAWLRYRTEPVVVPLNVAELIEDSEQVQYYKVGSSSASSAATSTYMSRAESSAQSSMISRAESGWARGRLADGWKALFRLDPTTPFRSLADSLPNARLEASCVPADLLAKGRSAAGAGGAPASEGWQRSVAESRRQQDLVRRLSGAMA